MQKLETLSFGKYYHIYNCGINGCKIFWESDNFEYFLTLYNRYISQIAETYAWVLMPNHFHLLVRIREFAEMRNPQGFEDPGGSGRATHQNFSNLFNAYTKAINKLYHRTGSLFEHPFHRKRITDLDYFKNLVIFIHNNPVYHGYAKHAMDYPWSSYLRRISLNRTNLKKNQVLAWFDNEANFKYLHAQRPGYFGKDDLSDVLP